MHFFDTVTETEKSTKHATVAIQCDLPADPPLQKLVPSASEPSLDDLFLTETEQDTDTHMLNLSITCKQDYTTEYVYKNITTGIS